MTADVIPAVNKQFEEIFMSKFLTIQDIQKMRYDSGAIVYNINNNEFAIVLDGSKGEDKDPCSLVIELNGKKAFAHTPPNRALLPTGRHINLDELLLHMNGSLNSIREENDNLFI